VDLAKDQRVQRIELAQQLGGVEDARMHARVLVPHRGHSHELHVRRTTLAPPRFDRRVDLEAVAAAVPERFDHFDLVGSDAGRLRGHDLLVVLAFLELRGRRRGLRLAAESQRGLYRGGVLRSRSAFAGSGACAIVRFADFFSRCAGRGIGGSGRGFLSLLCGLCGGRRRGGFCWGGLGGRRGRLGRSRFLLAAGGERESDEDRDQRGEELVHVAHPGWSRKRSAAGQRSPWM
jgi:hypothetical protein